MREPDKSRKSAWWRMRSACTALGRDRDGSAFFYTTLALPVLVGFAVLAIDGSRLMNLNSTLQHAADGMALAAAGELDRRPDACTRAERALENLVENKQMFGALGAATITIDDVEWRFLSELPTNDWDPIPASMEVDPQDPCDADSARVARFIEVWVKPQNFNTLFPASFLGGSNIAKTNAVAVAGFDAAVCKFTPMFICNPYEGTGTDIYTAVKDRSVRRKQIAMRRIGGGGNDAGSASYFPGNFGFLQVDDSSSASLLKEALAVDNPNACYLRDGVKLKTGAVASVGQGLNTRFGIYQGSYNSAKNDKKYRPALNVRKGYDGNTCGSGPQSPAVHVLPRDNCFEDSTCPAVPPNNATNRIGDGKWDYEGYMDLYGGTAAGPKDEDGNAFSNANPPTRFEVYRHEINNPAMLAITSPTGEDGRPDCGVAPSEPPDRRVFYGAVLNCTALDNDPDYGPLQGASNPALPAEAFASFFFTEPVEQGGGSSGEMTIWAEIIDVVEPGNNTEVARDRVQLFR